MRESKKSVKEVEIPKDFRDWWEPWGKDQETGASKGGHPDAYRVWARPEAKGYAHGSCGIRTDVAWSMVRYRNEFLELKQIGGLRRPKDFVSLAAPLQTQIEFWRTLKPILSQIGQNRLPSPEQETKKEQTEQKHEHNPSQ